MPYKSKVEHEREKWLTGGQALERVKLNDQCPAEEAWKRLQRAISDKALRVKWDEQFRPPDGIVLDEQTPANHTSFWLHTIMRFSDGYVLDFHVNRPIGDPEHFLAYALKKGGIFRPMLLERSAFDQLWPTPRVNVDPSSSIPPVKVGRPSVRVQIRSTLTELKAEDYHFAREKQTSLARLVLSKNCKTFEDRGWSQRAVVAHISEWLKDVGLSPR